MTKINYIPLLLTIIFASVLNALTSEIENFDHYTSTEELQADVSSFGNAAQAGRPLLSVGTGENGTNAAKYVLTWETGNNANLIFNNISGVSGNLSRYETITVAVHTKIPSGFIAPEDSTIVKLVIEGGASDTIWQTSASKAVQLEADVFKVATFELTDVEMKRIEGSESLVDVLANTSSIRLRFENTQQANVREFAYIDSITAITELPKSGTIIQLGLSDIQNDFKGI